MTKVIINGAKGRMGETLLRCGETNPDIEIVAGVDVGDDLPAVIEQTDVVIDFSFHESHDGQQASFAPSTKKRW